MGELISIIVPVYNAARYLKDCVDSIIAQNYDRWELILINDGSTDESKNIIAEYADKDSRIKAYHNENHGVSYTRNFGIDNATGEYLCFIDADDKILPDYLSSLLEKISENGADIVFCGCRLLYGDKLVNKAPKIKGGVYGFKDLSYRAIDDGTLSGIMFGSVWGALYRRSLVSEKGIRFDASVRRNEDGLFNLELLPYANKIAISEYTGYIYRQWQSVSRKVPQNKKGNELDTVSDMIIQRCPVYDEMDKQLNCRKLSILFWEMQKIAHGDQSAFSLASKLKAYVSDNEFDGLYHSLNFDALNRYKKTLINLIYRKRYLVFVILIKYVKPVLEKRLKH